MQIIELTEANEEEYFTCLEDWSDEIKEAGNHKELWYHKMKNNGLRVKLALDDYGTVGGMIQYIPIEQSIVDGKDLYFIYCIWVHGHKQGRGNFQHKGMGKALLESVENDAKERGVKGIAAWGISGPFWMKASWFKKQGYTPVDKNGISILLWKPFNDDANAPKWIKQKKKPTGIPGKVVVTAFKNGWCPASNMTFERAKRAVKEIGDDKVIFQAIETSDRDIFLEWGIADGLFIDEKEVRTGPPPSYRKIKKQIMKKNK